MKLDFLKTGVINTANFVPRFAFGDINMHPGVLIINLLGRLLSIYLCFQFNSELDIKSLILAILFPTLYIMYSIAVHGVDRILDLFGLERSTFEDIFKDSSDTCEERRGPDGDLPSIPADKDECESVQMGRLNSRIECEQVESTNTGALGATRNRHGVCKYTGDGTTEYRNCNVLDRQSSCNSSKLNCSWGNFPSSDTVYERCSYGWNMNDNKSKGVSFERCPSGCPYYFNENGSVELPVITGTLYHVDDTGADSDITVAADISGGSGTGRLIIPFNNSDTENERTTFKPLSTLAYNGLDITLFNKSNPQSGSLTGKIDRIIRPSGSSPTTSFTSTEYPTTDASLLGNQAATHQYTYLYIREWVWNDDSADSTVRTGNITEQLIGGATAGNLSASIDLRDTQNTCGEEYQSSGSMARVTGSSVLGQTTASDGADYLGQLTGVCQNN